MGVNRDKVLEPRKVRFWCPSCDRALISDGARCPVCGKRKLPKRRKK